MKPVALGAAVAPNVSLNVLDAGEPKAVAAWVVVVPNRPVPPKLGAAVAAVCCRGCEPNKPPLVPKPKLGAVLVAVKPKLNADGAAVVEVAA